MKIGIMQPYFFPYIGYFQLIDAVDIYVNLDHVNFMKRSYMTRNTLKNNTQITIPVIGGSQNKKCNEVIVKSDDKFVVNFPKTLYNLYGKEKNFKDIIQQIFITDVNSLGYSISQVNLFYIKRICDYLDITTEIIDSSEGFTEKKKNEGLQDIVGKLKGDTYINAIGGQKLYNKEDFATQNINLKFIKMDDVGFDNPYSSILDILFKYDKEYIQQQLKKYTLI
jgi:hypothetical protein